MPQGRNKTTDKKALIHDCAKELFSQHGFKDTNVPEITRKAGIAAGTFYLYYSSKESCFMEIFLEENEKLKRSMLSAVDMNAAPLDVIRDLLQQNMQGILENPILREWYNKESFSKIEEKYREQNGLGALDFMYSSFIDIVKKWQSDGKLRADIDSEMVMALFSSVIHLDLHKEEIGLKFFPEIQNYLMEFIMGGLTPRN